MSRSQAIAAVVGVVATLGVYYFKFVLPIAALKRQHPEVFAANAPSAVVGGLSGTIALLVVLVVTGVVILLLRGRR